MEETKQSNKTFNIEDFLEDDGFPINVAVVDPTIKDDTPKYILYTVKGEDKNGGFEIFRRYSDFHSLRTTLVQRWPGVFVPPIPHKRATGNFEFDIIEERRNFFELFLVELAKIKHLWYSDEFQVFLRTQNPIVEKALSTLPKIYYEDIISKYQETFKQLQGCILNQELELKISAFHQYLKRIRDTLEKYKQMTYSLMEARILHNSEFDKFMTFLLPQYEQTSLKEYVGNIVEGKYIFAEQNEPKLHQILTNIRELSGCKQFYSLYIELKQEIYEVDSFIETIETLYQYEQIKRTEEGKVKSHEKELSKAQEGKTGSLKKLFSSKSNDQRIQEETLKVDLHNGIVDKVSQILDLIKVIIGYIEIDKFKHQKVEKYYATIKAIAIYEYEFAKQKAELWKHVIENEHVGIADDLIE